MSNDESKDNFDYLLKRDNICVIGPVNDGKHVFFEQLFPCNKFSDFGILTQLVEIGDDRLKVQVWMKRGGERFDYRSISKRSYDAMLGIFLCYNYCLRYTFDSLDKWLECIRRECSPDVAVMLVGNKYVHNCMTDDREVSFEEGRHFAERNGLMFMEISTDLEIVDAGFMELMKKVYELHKHKLARMPPPTSTSNAVIQVESTSERKCSI